MYVGGSKASLWIESAREKGLEWLYLTSYPLMLGQGRSHNQDYLFGSVILLGINRPDGMGVYGNPILLDKSLLINVLYDISFELGVLRLVLSCRC